MTEQLSAPEWRPEDHPKYNQHLAAISDEIMLEIQSNPEARLALLRNPRYIHARLYGPLTPRGYEEYAGTYRGTIGTSLETRQVQAVSAIDQNRSRNFVAPEKVSTFVTQFCSLIEELAHVAMADKTIVKFNRAVRLFYVFGMVHPFLDGNGHVQRLIFAAAVLHQGLVLKDSWSIHPRPYDVEIARAFEAPEPFKALQAILSEHVDLSQ
jgi:fido (protein-threonine AMPylation protein)